MDILSHGLWGMLYAKAMNQRRKQPAAKKPVSLRWATLWGIFPDLVAFGPAFIWLGWALVSGEHSLNDLPFRNGDRQIPGMMDRYILFELSHSIYDFSHSLVVLFFCAAVWVLIQVLFGKKRFSQSIPWAMGGWLIHVLMDIPTHSSEIFPTPVFWPLSDWKFMYGIAWVSMWIWGANVLALIGTYIFLRHRERSSVA